MATGSSPIAVVLGTRPEIIKLARIIELLDDRAVLIHTGQHYDDSLSAWFLNAFGIAVPAETVGIGGTSRGEQIGNGVAGLSQKLSELAPAAVVVQGDTNSTLAAALAANSLDLPLVHVEAGLRSFDRSMPEEHNRVLTDHLADLCLAPTTVSVDNLTAERIPDSRIVITGNTVVEAVNDVLPSREDRLEILQDLNVESGSFVLSTFHRPENVDDPARLESIIRQLSTLDLPVLLPLHPRSRHQAEEHGLWPLPGVRVGDPVDYPTFLALLAEAALFVGDSGGVQEEVSILKRPMVVVRRSTERPEVLGTFSTLVPDPEQIASVAAPLLHDVEATLDRLRDIPSPFGDGSASDRSVKAIDTMLETGKRPR